jgi:hypothetical protein
MQNGDDLFSVRDHAEELQQRVAVLVVAHG